MCDKWTVASSKKRRKAVKAVKAANVHIRVSAEQKEAIAAAASKSGMTVSTWLLHTALQALKRADEGAEGEK